MTGVQPFKPLRSGWRRAGWSGLVALGLLVVSSGTVAYAAPLQSDLGIAASVNDSTPNVGDTVTFTVMVTNAGPDAATNATVTELLPPGLTIVGAIPSAGSYDASSGLWSIGTVTTTTPQTLVLTARVVSPNAATATASISHADQFDPAIANNTASVTETPQRADLTLSTAVSDAVPNVGDTITFTVTLANLGPDTATGVALADVLPAGLAFLSATPSQGSYNAITGLWTVGTVSPSTPQTLTIVARVVGAAPTTNTATISHADQFDPNPANNSASATVNPQPADLALSKAVSDPHPHVGDTITFTVTLTNNGPDTATGVAITDPLPAGLTFVSATPSQGSLDATTGVWTVGTVSPGTPQTLTIVARVVGAAPTTNVATISHADQFDPNPANNSASATVTPAQADLAAALTVDDSTPQVGQQVTFTATVTNNGPDAATGVTATVLDPPATLTFVSATPSVGSYDPTSGLWTIGNLAAGASATLLVTFDASAAGTESVTAALAGSALPDTVAGNDAASVTVTVTASAVVTPPAPSPSASATSPSGSGELAATGAPANLPFVLVAALVAMASGVLLLLAARRRRHEG